MRPTRRMILLTTAATLVALAPVIVAPSLWVLWPVALAWLVLAFGIDIVLAPKRHTAAFRIELPDMLYIGSADRAKVFVELASPRDLPIRLAVDLSDELQPQPELKATMHDGRVELDVALVPRRRGTARVEGIWLRFRGPLGLASGTVRRELDDELSVVPDVQAVRSVALRFSADRDFRAGLKIERFKGEGTEFDSLKEFTQGDDSRTIDWKPSARHNKLLCRQFRAERDHQVMLAVDTGHLMAERLGGIPKLDHALNTALVLSYVCLQHGDRVGFFTFGAKVGLLLQPQGGIRTQLAITRMTSRVRYSDAETNFTLGLTTLGQRVRRRSLIVVLTDFVDTVGAELLLENVDRLSRRHVVVFVALRDPELGQLAGARPVGPVALNRAVMAQNFVQDREVVMKRLRRMGIIPIDAEPSRIGTQLIDSYLGIKRREMI